MTIGALMIPLIGLILLIVGFVERTRSQKQPPPMPPGYPGQTPPNPQFGSPYPPPPPGHWPPPRPKPRGTALIVTGAVILGLSLVGGVVRAADSSDASSGRSPDGNTIGHLDSATALTIGQCVADSDFGKGAPEPTDCGDPSAVMEHVSRGGANADCPDGNGHEDTDYTTLFWDNATMCFVANFLEDQCYAVNTADPSESPFTHEDCDDPRAAVKAVHRFDGTTDTSQCSPGTKPISYKQPARLFCLKAVQ